MDWREITLVRYDPRGNVSDWDVDEPSLEAWVSDLETDTIGIERLPLLGVSQCCAISIACAARHLERFSHLILYGGFALGGGKLSPGRAMGTLMRLGWGMDDPAFRQMFTSQFIPGLIGSTTFNGSHLKSRLATLKSWEFRCARIAPTFVMHVRDDLVVTIDAGRQMAAGIPGARFIVRPERNYLRRDQSVFD
jgi:pimeloyl-ACP methyl ester carboxylesterase